MKIQPPQDGCVFYDKHLAFENNIWHNISMKYACIVFTLWLLAALTMQGLNNLSGMQTTVDAFMFNFTIDGRDIGERLMVLWKDFIPAYSQNKWVGALYLVGFNIAEELIKFLFFIIAILLLKPISTRRVLYTGMLIGAWFATLEHFSFRSFISSSWTIFPLRLFGHMLFTSVIALWYSLGSFARMRWIDNGARAWLAQFFLSKWSGFIMGFWIITGLLLSAFAHSVVNIFASQGHYMAIIIIALGWVGILFSLLNKNADRPYGRILQEIKLMQMLHDIQTTLNTLQHPLPVSTSKSWENPDSHFETKKIRLSRKQFAKK